MPRVRCSGRFAGDASASHTGDESQAVSGTHLTERESVLGGDAAEGSESGLYGDRVSFHEEVTEEGIEASMSLAGVLPAFLQRGVDHIGDFAGDDI